MLSDYPVKINNVELFPANKWDEDSEVVENVQTSEAGTDITTVARYDKLAVSAEYRCHSPWLGKFKAWSKADTLTVQIYDPVTDKYMSRTMRMRNFKTSLIEFSEKVKDTQGIWNVSFTLEEF